MNRIPKIIHYCWFGHNVMPKWQVKNIREWKSKCPDYKFIKWTETNFDVFGHSFTAKAYKQHNWAFVSDYVRLYALKKFGGIYLDTDIKILKPFNSLLNREAFMGLETWSTIDCGLGSGSVPHEKNISAILNIYNKRGKIPKKLGDFNDNIVTVISNYFIDHGLKNRNKEQNINGCTIFPIEYFNPKDRATGKINITKNTFTVHSYANSWTGESLTKRRRFNIYLGHILKRIIGPRIYNYLYGIHLRNHKRS